MRFRTRVRDIMTAAPVYSKPDATIESVARLMAEANCGEIPICEEGKVLGIITDRDIACRTVARGKDPARTAAREVMTMLPVTVDADAPLETAIQLMEQEHIRRMPVVDERGIIVGTISQVDVAARASQRKAGHMLAQLQPPPVARV